MRRGLIRQLAILGLSAGLVFGAPAQAQNKADPTVGFQADDRQMQRAVRTAIRTLPAFLSNTFNAQGVASSRAELKVAIPTKSGPFENEIIWVDTLRRNSDGTFSGKLANRPRDLGRMRLGSKVRFSQGSIRDWGFIASDGRLFGHYSTRVIADRTGDAQLSAILTPNPVPQNW